MPKNSQYTSNNAQKQGGGGFLSEAVKGECVQVWNNGMTFTERHKPMAPATWPGNNIEPTYYHRPFFGDTIGKQPSADKE